MFDKIIVATLFLSASLASPVALAQSDAAGDSEASSVSAQPQTRCDLAAADRWSAAAQAVVDKKPDKHLDRCPEIAAYARAAASPASLPQPCADFAVLASDRRQVALYSWAYGSAILLLQERGQADRAERLGRALSMYNAQFEEYERGIAEFSDLCQRVHSPAHEASAADLQIWSRSGRSMRSAVDTRRSTIWDRHAVKSALDRSFASLVEALK